MADFVQVMNNWRRMCGACTCSNRKELEGFPMCPIVLKHCGYPCDECPQDWSEEATKQFEEIVMQWAAEHPEPMYPAWRDWLRDLYGNPKMTMTDILESPIDPEIARRLDIVSKRVR